MRGRAVCAAVTAAARPKGPPLPIDPSRTVAELVLEQPSRARVFEELGIDYCCGGKTPLAEACAARGLAVDDAATALDAAVELPTSERDLALKKPVD